MFKSCICLQVARRRRIGFLASRLSNFLTPFNRSLDHILSKQGECATTVQESTEQTADARGRGRQKGTQRGGKSQHDKEQRRTFSLMVVSCRSLREIASRAERREQRQTFSLMVVSCRSLRSCLPFTHTSDTLRHIP